MNFIPLIIICYTSKRVELQTFKILSGIKSKIVVLRIEFHLLIFLFSKYRKLKKIIEQWFRIQKTIQQFTIENRFCKIDLNYQSLLICNIFYPFFLYI